MVKVSGALLVGLTMLAASLSHSLAEQGQSPVDPDGHVHHVVTPQGCVALDATRFAVAANGLHQGASQSGHERGPWHGSCPAS